MEMKVPSGAGTTLLWCCHYKVYNNIYWMVFIILNPYIKFSAHKLKIDVVCQFKTEINRGNWLTNFRFNTDIFGYCKSSHFVGYEFQRKYKYISSRNENVYQ